MNRRILLAGGACSLGLLIAGCLDGRGSSNGPGDGGRTNGNGTNGSTDTDGEPAVGETRFEVLDVQSSDAEETASVTFDDGTVTVTGAIRGNNGCYTARLGATTIEDGTLLVSVESYEDAEPDQDCTQAVVVIDYRATVEVDGGSPGSVAVEHDGDEVTTSRP